MFYPNFPSSQVRASALLGRPRLSIRLMVALLYLKHAYNESDDRFAASLALQPRRHSGAAVVRWNIKPGPGFPRRVAEPPFDSTGSDAIRLRRIHSSGND
jgi:hypothetical protein